MSTATCRSAASPRAPNSHRSNRRFLRPSRIPRESYDAVRPRHNDDQGDRETRPGSTRGAALHVRHAPRRPRRPEPPSEPAVTDCDDSASADRARCAPRIEPQLPCYMSLPRSVPSSIPGLASACSVRQETRHAHRTSADAAASHAPAALDGGDSFSG